MNEKAAFSPAAAKQLDAKFLGTATSVEYKSHEVALPSDAFITSSRIVPFMFEGVTKGDALCTLELRYKGTPLARYSVPIRLKKVSQFVEEYSVSQTDDDQDHDPLQTARAEHTLPDPVVDGRHDYILFVHGWNWEDWQKKAYGYSTFKRLYWLGYKGTFGIFKWPDTYGLTSALTFDNSEVHALESGAGLKGLIMDLKDRGFKVNIYAHSQGCMVVSEALRQIALDTTIAKPVVESMTFSQAAVSARMYDENYPAYDDWEGLRDNLVTWPVGWYMDFASVLCPGTLEQWPDLQGHYPYYLEMTGYPHRYAPYFEPVQQAVRSGMMFNFYNPDDYPTGEYNHDAGRFSGSWLIDQLIKHHRKNILGLQFFRTVKMNYGLDGLGTESKKYFTRDATRQDYFCLSLPIDLFPGCTVSSCIPGTRMYDFADPETRYKLLAYGGASYSRALGGHDSTQHLDPSSGFLDWRANEVNLSSPARYSYGKYVMWHGAQFRGMLAKQKDYWGQFLLNIGIQTR